MPDTGYMLTLGPIDYLYFLREIQSFDYLRCWGWPLCFGVPAFLWMRPPVAAAHPSEMGGQGSWANNLNAPAPNAG